MDTFCRSQFWNWNTTWYTDDPDLTVCFENTILIWFPCAFLWLSSFIDIYFFATSKFSPIPLSKLGVSKNVCNVSIIFLTIAHILQAIFLEGVEIAPVWIYSCIIKTSTFILALILLTCDRIKGFRSSGVLLIFWFAVSLGESIILRTVIKNGSESKSSLAVRATYCFFIYVLFLLNCWADRGPSVFRQDHDHTLLADPDDGIPYPETKSSFLSRISFYWVGDLIYLGYKRPLVLTDLWNLRVEDKTRTVCSEFLSHCKRKLLYENSNESEENSKGWFSALVVPLFKTFWLQYIVLSLLILISNLLWVVTPKILSYIINFVAQGPSENIWKGYFFAVLLLSVSILQAFVYNRLVYFMWTVCYRVRAAVNCAIYKKALVTSTIARKGTSVGQIVNLMSVDAEKLMSHSSWLPYLIPAPIQIIIATYFLYEQLGVAAFAGVSIMFFLIPANIIIMKKSQTLQRAQMKKKDERVKMMNEILSGIKIIKLYGWEPSFVNKVEEIRNDEIKLLKTKAYIQSFNSFLWKLAPFYVSLTCFTTYLLIDPKNNLNAEKAFVSLALFNLLKEPLSAFYQLLTTGIDCIVSLKRINEFMNCTEKDPNAVIRRTKTTISDHDDNTVSIENGDFTWDEEKLILKDININVKKGSLVAIVGAVGSGKSSILEALLGEMKKMRGQVTVTGSLAYVSQLPYIQNATVVENVTFGLPLDTQKYENIIDCCALRPDLEILPGRDQTEIGEKGINLSGGQKQRVALARAAYHNADVYLLDDPLSSVDSNVGNHIFHHLIGPEGLLKNKTRLFVTNGVSFLPYVDQIIVISNGEISECGTYADLLQRKGLFSDFLKEYGTKNGKEVKGEHDAENLRDGREPTDKPEISKLIEEEKPETGTIKKGVIKDYVKCVGWLASLGTLVGFTVFQSFSIGGNMWLSAWSKENISHSANTTVISRETFLIVYGVIGLGQCIFLFGAACFIYLGTLQAAKKLHNNMLLRILRAPMWYFDTTPLGRIVNRFGVDVQTLDQGVPGILYDVLWCLFQILATVIVVCFSTPIFLIVIVLIAPAFIAMQRYFAAASRQIFRLNSVSRSPIFAHFSETLNGVTTIRAYEAQERFIEECERRIDDLQKTLLSLTASRRWLTFRLQLLGSLFIFFTVLFAMMEKDTLSPSIVGLSISYALFISTTMSSLTIWLTFLETQIVSAERILEYTNIDQEDEWKHLDRGPSNDWPENGAISFREYQTRYREGTNLVLNGITCDIQPGEKIGIVGRTGAGKSSITLGLFRILEATGGSITIDGEDISKLGLHDIRGRLTIIPQDPVLFSGTLRFNLDPFNSCDDSQLWRALELSYLKSFVLELTSGLDHQISEGGGNLSTGQRQLVCLARAILRECKILVLDEATAAVDMETDCLIQKTIRQHFKDCTVITIAHRLNTIIDSNRIIVLAQGEIQEFDAPRNLLAKSNSQFYDMAKSAGLV